MPDHQHMNDGSVLIGTELGMRRHNTETRDPMDLREEKIIYRGEAGTITIDKRMQQIYVYASDGDYAVTLGRRELARLLDMLDG